MSDLLDILPPRSFSDLTVPLRPDGTALETCRQKGDYERYVAWVADYLHRTDLPLTEEQKAWLEGAGKDPKGIIFTCSDVFGYTVDALEELTWWFTEGKTYDDYKREMREIWEAHTDPEDKAEFGFQVLSEATFQRLKREWEEECARGECSHADIPFRALLAWALRQMPDAEERQKEMDWFFRNFQDNASK